MKKCTICKVEKDCSDFNKNRARKDGLNNICKECSKERSKRYYKEKGEIHKDNVVKRNKKNRKVLQDFILNYFVDNHCKDCGNKDVRVLEFDHLPEFEKSNDISTMVGNSCSLKSLEEEINKCEVVCANCHKIRTIERAKTHYRKIRFDSQQGYSSSRSSYG